MRQWHQPVPAQDARGRTRHSWRQLASRSSCHSSQAAAMLCAGAILLARSLKNWDNEGVRLLDLGYNDVGDHGACQLALVCLRAGSRYLHQPDAPISGAARATRATEPALTQPYWQRELACSPISLEPKQYTCCLLQQVTWQHA